MDKNTTSSMERRFSFNTTHIANPIAESTCLNGTTSGAHFYWGGTPISPKSRSNSSICLSSASSSGMSQSGCRSSATSPQRNGRANISKIDPRIYADVQSKGLASRIVKYHESGTRLSRSMSASNLYTKPGQFPVVHLKKTELPYKATKQHLSMTRIAPPEKSMFYGNTLSSLLRSNSIIGLQKTDEEISRENRPILHPPPTENELAPTRSVLDVLKEISRKRINSDDMDPNDTTKKYCNRDNNDAVDTTIPIHHNHQQQQQQQQQAKAIQSYKRQREQFNGNNNQHYSSQIQSSCTSSTTGAAGRTQMQQHSPEQAAKKRLCGYNNDITSSLSSSIIHNNKRKYYEQSRGKTSPINDTMRYSRASPTTGSSDNEHESQKAKIQRYQPDLHLQQFAQTLNCNTPITPIPPTPVIQSVETLSISLPTISATTTAGAAQRTSSEPIYSSKPASLLPPSSTSSPSTKTDTTATSKSKPKLTLFNRKYDEKAETEKEKTEDDGEYAGIQFVKPKKSSSISSTKNALIERTQKSKLALMLCGLRGELYQGEEQEEKEKQRQQQIAARKKDEVDAATKQQSKTPIASTTTTAATSLPPPTTTTATVLATKSNITGINSLKAKETLPDTAEAAATATSKSLTSSGAPTLTSTITQTPTTATVTTSALGGFKFTPPSTAGAASTAPTKTTSPLVGLKLAPQTTAATVMNSNAATMPQFSFGTTNNANASVTTAAALPVLGGFTFSTGGANKSLNFATISTPQLNGGLGESFSFSPTTAAVSGAAAVAPPGFGSLTNTSAPFTFGSTTAPAAAATTTTTTTSATASSLPTFGAATSAPPPSFDNLNTTTNIGNDLPKAFALGAPSIAGAESNKMPTAFGASAANLFAANSSNSSNSFAAPADVATKSFSFGNTAASASTTATAITATTTPASGGFSFNTATAHKPSTLPFTFGGSTASGQPPAMQSTSSAFAAPNFTTAPAPIVSSSNTFSFGSTAPNVTSAAANNSFSFGSGNNVAAGSTTNSLMFGSGSTNSSASNVPFAFGSGAATTTQQQTQAQQPPAYTFGGGNGGVAANRSTNVSPFAFGGTAKTDKPTPAGGFTFSTSASASPATVAATSTAGTTNFFATPLTNAGATTGIVKPTFSFGNSNTTTATDAAVKPSLFGTGAGLSHNTFGSLAAASGSGAGDSTNNNQNKTFAFATNNNNTTLPSNNIFGGGSSTTNDNHKPIAASGGFSFGAATINAQQQQNKPTQNVGAFTFGSSASIGNNAASSAPSNTVAPFSFGGTSGSSNMAAPKIGAPANKTFAFGGSSSGNAATAPTPGNIFSGASAATNNANAALSFNFNAGGGANAATGPSAIVPPNASNMFAAPHTMAPPTDRPIRRATRRLQKS